MFQTSRLTRKINIYREYLNDIHIHKTKRENTLEDPAV